jgi:hypothetical protein
LTARFASQFSDFGHVLPISTNGLTTLTASLSGFLWGELMRMTPLMRNLAAFACDLSLLLGIHSGESSGFLLFWR